MMNFFRSIILMLNNNFGNLLLKFVLGSPIVEKEGRRSIDCKWSSLYSKKILVPVQYIFVVS